MRMNKPLLHTNHGQSFSCMVTALPLPTMPDKAWNNQALKVIGLNDYDYANMNSWPILFIFIIENVLEWTILAQPEMGEDQISV
jgi:hypothetical protein